MDQIVSIPFPDPSTRGKSSKPTGHQDAQATLPFFVGDENRLVEQAVWAVLQRSGTAYNPIVLAGDSGTGKSHVAHGLAAAYRSQFARHTVICLAAVDFARQWADALESQSTEAFRRRYREAQLIIIEDLTRLADNERAQQTLIHVLDDAVAEGHQIVVTASSLPGRWIRISAALQSRLEAGLCIRLVPPSDTTRQAILRHLAKQRGLRLTEPVTQILANGLEGNVRDLLAAIGNLSAAERLEGQAIDAGAARAYVARQRTATAVDLSDITAAVARVFALPVAQLRSRSQNQKTASARGVAMYLARQITDLSLEQIGQYFGGRDHTTVLHHCRKIQRLRDSEPTIEQSIIQVENLLRSQHPTRTAKVAAAM